MLKLVYNAATDRRPKPEPEEEADELVIEFQDELELPRFLQPKNLAEKE